jgi:hypothetical protein
MEIIIAIVLLAIIAYVGYTVLNKENADGSHPLDAPTQAPYKVEPPKWEDTSDIAITPRTTKADGIGHESVLIQPTISNVLDVNKDGKVDFEDVKEAAKKTKKKAKEVTTQVVEQVKKTRGRKPKAE